MAVSIREVAAFAGVSRGTVSKALNNAAGAQLAPQTRERVRHAAKTLGYHPSAVARALSRKTLDTIGIVQAQGVSSPIRAGFFASIFDALFEAAANNGQNTTVFTGHRWKNAADSLPIYSDGRCDGFILFFQPDGSDILPALAGADIPLVLVSDTIADPRITCVDVDSRQGMRVMTEHLLSLGHERIAILAGDQPASSVAPRVAGWRDALRSAGREADPHFAPSGDYSAESVEARVHTLLELPSARRPTAFLLTTDEMAFTAIRALQRLGLRVPDDISVAGFNDVFEAQSEHPPLTTMRQPFGDIADRALSLLLAQIEDINRRGEKIHFPAELIVRGSTAPPPGKRTRPASL